MATKTYEYFAEAMRLPRAGEFAFVVSLAAARMEECRPRDCLAVLELFRGQATCHLT
jgi:hypothetical protein